MTAALLEGVPARLAFVLAVTTVVLVVLDLLVRRLPAADAERLRWAALLRDIGTISVPGPVLNPSGRLDQSEWHQVGRHPEEGARLAAGLRPFLGPWWRGSEHATGAD